MVEMVTGSSDEGFTAAAQLLHDFNLEYDEPAPPPAELAARLAELVAGAHITVLLARAQETGAAVGVTVLRVQPSVWSPAQEVYLAELYVIPGRRGEGYGRELITEAMRVARERGADYAFLITSEDDRMAQRLYEAAGFRRTEGDDGPLMLAYEREMYPSCTTSDCRRTSGRPASPVLVPGWCGVLVQGDRSCLEQRVP